MRTKTPFLSAIIVSILLGALLTLAARRAIAAQSGAAPLTNADVLRFVTTGLPESVVVNLVSEAVQTKTARFDLSETALAELASHGVSPTIIAAMRAPVPAPIGQTAPAPSPPKPVVAVLDCSPRASANLKRLTRELRSANPTDDNAFLAALDRAANVGPVTFLTGVIEIRSTDALSIFAIFPYGAYRLAISESLRKKEPIDGALVPEAVGIVVSPSQINAPDIIKIIVEREGKTIAPLGSTLVPTPMTTRMGAREVLHAGTVLYPCSAFAPGAAVTVTAIPQIGFNIVKTISSDELWKMR